jgi:hypothetical protein
MIPPAHTKHTHRKASRRENSMSLCMYTHAHEMLMIGRREGGMDGRMDMITSSKSCCSEVRQDPAA